jgi:hypothetical protein
LGKLFPIVKISSYLSKGLRRFEDTSSKGGFMETVIVIMLKDSETGFLDKELASLTLNENEDYIVNLFAIDEADGRKLHIRLSTGRDVSDWEYEAIFDYYDSNCFGDSVISVTDIDDDYNPAWEVIMDYDEDIAALEEKVIDVLSKHKTEMNDVFETICDKEAEYSEQ